MSGRRGGRVKTLNVNHGRGRGGKGIDAGIYRAMRAAILGAVPRGKGGISLPDLLARVRRTVPEDLFRGRSIPWYAATVKLDLEARGLLRRVPGSRPQRIVRGGG
jgi:hypothetical protein